MDFEYVLLGLIVLLGAVTMIVMGSLLSQREEIVGLKKIVFGVDNDGFKSRKGSLENQIRELRESSLKGDLNTLGDIISPLIEAQYKKDIELVLKADYPNSKGFSLDFREGSFLVFINNYYPHDIFINERFRNQISEHGLSKIIRRAAELRDLQAKLCCKKPQAKKVVKKSTKKKAK